MISIREKTLTFDEHAWATWHQERIKAASSPLGPTSLIATRWISATTLSNAQEFPNLPGRWYRRGGGVVGIHLPPSFTTTGTLQILPGEIAQTTSFNLAIAERLGEIALEVYDRQSPAETRFRTIETHPPAAQWQLRARFYAQAESVNLTAADGHIVPTPTVGWVVFEKEGREFRLRVCNVEQRLRAVFSDKTTSQGVFRFRCLDIEAPNTNGETVVDFNRAYLPAVAFSEHFLCAGPSIANGLNLEVEASEKWVVGDF